MKNNDIDNHILLMNFVEFLTNFLEGRVSLPMLFKLNERIYARDPKTLSQALIAATATIHDLKEQIDRGEGIDKETIINTIDDVMLDLMKD